MRVAVLAGGVGGARFLRGVREHVTGQGGEVTAIVNTGDDITLHGLRICPDLDSVMYGLGGGADRERGWGRAEETWTVKAELQAYGVGPDWFGLGDRDLATHLARAGLLQAGLPLSAVTDRLCRRWRPGVRILPATDDPVETHVVVTKDDPGVTEETGTDQGDGAARARQIHFQEWWVRYRAALPARGFVYQGADSAKPAPGVTEALTSADAVLLAPSNPVVSIAPILAIPGIREALRAAAGPVVGVSPIIGGAPVRGMANACLTAIGVPCTAAGVGSFYGARRTGGLLDRWLVDAAADAGAEVAGVAVRPVPLWMTDDQATAAMVAAALEA